MSALAGFFKQLFAPKPPGTVLPFPQPAKPSAPGPIKMPWDGKHKDAAAWTVHLLGELRASKLPDIKLSDASNFSGLLASPDREQRVIALAQLIAIMAQFESNFKPTTVYHEPPPLGIDSVGLLQLSYEDARHYNTLPALDRSKRSLEDPLVNLTCTVRIMEHLVSQDKQLAGLVGSKYKGLSRYWSVMRELKAGKARPSYTAIRAHMLGLSPAQPPVENHSPVASKSETPWMDWLNARKGWSESTHDRELSVGWRYTSVPSYKTIVGADHAWCKMTVNFAMHETGYKYNQSAAAVKGLLMGTPCEKKYGAIKIIEHSNGRHHITFVDHEGDLGGNQRNKICVNPIDPTDKVLGYRWPEKA